MTYCLHFLPPPMLAHDVANPHRTACAIYVCENAMGHEGGAERTKDGLRRCRDSTAMEFFSDHHRNRTE